MSQNNSIKDAEKRVFRFAEFQDGIWEIYLGLNFTLLSLFPVTRNLLGPVINAVMVLGVSLTLAGMGWFLKKNVILPRAGVVKLSERTKKKVRTGNMIMGAIVLATFALMILASKQMLSEPTWGSLPQWVSDFDLDMIFALLIIIIFGVIARSFGVSRFYLYGVLLGIGNFTSAVMLVYQGKEFQWSTAAAGGIILLMGIAVLVKFLRDYPMPKGVQNV